MSGLEVTLRLRWVLGRGSRGEKVTPYGDKGDAYTAAFCSFSLMRDPDCVGRRNEKIGEAHVRISPRLPCRNQTSR